MRGRQGLHLPLGETHIASRRPRRFAGIVEFIQAYPFPPTETSSVDGARARSVHIPDVLEDPEYRWGESQQRGRPYDACVPFCAGASHRGPRYLG